MRRRLAAQPENPGLLRRLADTQRMLGQLEKAREGYRRLLALAPDPAVDWLVDVLGSEPLPPPPPGLRAVPFARVSDVLGAADYDWLLRTTMAAPQCMVPARIGDNTADPDFRRSFVADQPLRHAVRRWFVPKLQAALPAILTRLASDCRGLRSDQLSDYRFETNLTLHQSGGFYQAHKDTSDDDDERADRRLSFVFYFGRVPRRFDGGDLLLYDTSYDEGQKQINAHLYTRVAPLPNSLVVFPSDSVHEITRVVSPTGDPLDFADCRLTVNGWIHATREPLGKSLAA